MRAIAIDWTAWGGIGMATRGSIPKVMEMAGIDMLPPEAGVPWIRRELTAGGTAGEVLVAQSLGLLQTELDAEGGVDTIACAERIAGDIGEPERSLTVAAPIERMAGPLTGHIAGMGVHRGLTIDTELDPALQPFLYDHQIEGTPVLPGVIGIEAFAEAALWPLDGWHIEAIEDVNFHAPFKFYRAEPRVVSTEAVFRPDGQSIVADCKLIGRRTLANQTDPQVTTHFTGRVRLAKDAPPAPPLAPPSNANQSIIEAADIYRIYFHGPAYQVIERASWSGKQMIGQFAARLPEHHHPNGRPLVVAPRLIELCFQTAGLCEMVMHHRMGLPLHAGRIRVYRAPGSDALFAVITPTGDGFDAQVVDAAGNCYLDLAGYRTIAFREVPGVHLLAGASIA